MATSESLNQFHAPFEESEARIPPAPALPEQRSPSFPQPLRIFSFFSYRSLLCAFLVLSVPHHAKSFTQWQELSSVLNPSLPSQYPLFALSFSVSFPFTPIGRA